MSSSSFLAKARQQLAVGTSLFALLANLGAPAAAQQPAKPTPTATPIKHLIVIIGENRSFDHVFATYKPKNGTDGGLLPAPLSMHYLIFSPGERFDIVIDFSQHAGMNLALTNDAPAPYARGGEIVPSDVMLFKVTKPLSGKDTSSLPDALLPWSPLNPAHAVRERTLSLTEMDRASDGYTMIGLLDQKHWDDPITEDPKAGTMEIWSFANTTGDVHPMHIHQVQFQVLNRQPFDTKTYL
jgi:spore coat protein A